MKANEPTLATSTPDPGAVRSRRPGRGRQPTAPPPPAPSAVAWINGRQAVVATIDPGEHVTTCEIGRGVEPTDGFVELVVRAIGPRERVLILGPSSIRLELEQAYVDLHPRGQVLVDVEPAGQVEVEDLVERVRRLAA